jgi:NADH:ubiquinone oxidoreductase subunit F (NADH-binding)
MTRLRNTLRTCSKGHQFYKSSDCNTCPVCESLRKPGVDFLALLSAPARRALERAGIDSLEKLSCFRESEILALHGIGPTAIPKLRSALKNQHLQFKRE